MKRWAKFVNKFDSLKIKLIDFLLETGLSHLRGEGSYYYGRREQKRPANIISIAEERSKRYNDNDR